MPTSSGKNLLTADFKIKKKGVRGEEPLLTDDSGWAVVDLYG